MDQGQIMNTLNAALRILNPVIQAIKTLSRVDQNFVVDDSINIIPEKGWKSKEIKGQD